jgi:hypothetical protein
MGKSELKKTETAASARQAVRRTNRRARSARRGSPDGHSVVDPKSTKNKAKQGYTKPNKVKQGGD